MWRISRQESYCLLLSETTAHADRPLTDPNVESPSHPDGCRQSHFQYKDYRHHSRRRWSRSLSISLRARSAMDEPALGRPPGFPLRPLGQRDINHLLGSGRCCWLRRTVKPVFSIFVMLTDDSGRFVLTMLCGSFEAKFETRPGWGATLSHFTFPISRVYWPGHHSFWIRARIVACVSNLPFTPPFSYPQIATTRRTNRATCPARSRRPFLQRRGHVYTRARSRRQPAERSATPDDDR